jgi:hypothetical protein
MILVKLVTKPMYWDSLHNNSSEKDKIDTTLSTFV